MASDGKAKSPSRSNTAVGSAPSAGSQAIVTVGRATAEDCLTVRKIVKRFGPLRAVNGIDATFRTGEVHGLLGENGAGKSTLVKMLSGIYQPDDGAIDLCGHPVDIASPLDARRIGISVVHQHSTLVPALTVLENVNLVEGGFGPSSPHVRARLIATASELGFDIDPEARASALSVGQRQRVEITRALMHEARFVLLDEPTSVLALPERAELFAVIDRLVAGGAGVVLVTHRLDEARLQCDRLTMLRQGSVVGVSDHPMDLKEEDLVRTLVGEVPTVARTPRPAGRVVVEARRLRGAPPGGRALEGIDLVVHSGEVLGIAGVEGNGQRELAAALVGSWRPDDGVVELEGRAITDIRPREIGARVADVADEDSLALVSDFSIWENFALRRLAWDMPPTPLRRRRLRREAVDLVQSFEIKTPSVDTAVARLSGGNRRRVLLARELSKRPRLVVSSYASKGLDVRSIEQVKGWINRLADEGAAVVYIGAELDEVLALADRVAVLSRGRIVGCLPAAEATVDEIGKLMLGSTSEDGQGP